MTRNRNRGYCAVCDKEYSNLYQHNRTQGHKERASKHASKQESSQDGTVTYIETDSSITASNNSSMGNMDEAKGITEHSIKIIDGTVKESKSAIKEIVEIATSEQFMPITLSLLQGLANLANGHLNKEQASGMIKTQGGLEREDF